MNTPSLTPVHQSLTKNFSALSVTVNIAPSYPIWIGDQLLANSTTFKDLPSATSAVIISNETIAPLYLYRLKTALDPHFPKVLSVILPDGEQYKNWENLQTIFTALLHNNCDRKCLLFALGGGVIGDMTGFAAACYQRGVPFVQIPTTLLAQVDSSVGGKTGINHPLGKNMVGAFYQPLRVICDTATLRSLPAREFNSGLAEIIKYGPIADVDFFAWIEHHIDDLLARDTQALTYAIQRSCEIKAWVVEQDERESGLRAILNFGHTFAHAIEAGLGYGQWLHGEAVACGMVMAAQLSSRMNLADTSWVNRLTQLLNKAQLPTQAPILDAHDNVAAYLSWMQKDKKNLGGTIRFTLINPPHIAHLQAVPTELVHEVIKKSVPLVKKDL